MAKGNLDGSPAPRSPRLRLVGAAPAAEVVPSAPQSLNLSVDAFSELVHLVYSGATESVPWAGFLTRMGRLLDANWVTLLLRPPAPDRHGLVLAWKDGYPVRMATNYNLYAYAMDPFVQLPLEQVLSMDEVIDNSELRRSEFYKQILEPENIGQMLGFDFRATIPSQTGHPGSMGMVCHFRACRPGDVPRFSESHRKLLKMFIPHLRQAVHLHSQIDVMVTERELYAGAVDRLHIGMVILDETGVIIKTTISAQSVLKEADGISLVNGAIKLAYEQENRKLQRLVQEALAKAKKHKPSIAEALAVTRPSGRSRLGLVVRAIPHNTWSEGKCRPTVAVMIRDPERKAEASHEVLRNLYEFTPSEAALALRLANGLTLEEASAALDIRKNTARAHLRSIFSKTGVTRQTMLVRLILGGLSIG